MATGSKRVARAPELLAWAMTPSAELLDLTKRHDKGALANLGEYRPFYFEERFFTPRDRFDDYLFQAQEFGWPVFYLAHFAELYPIGASGGGDHWLARVTADAGGTSRVYHYDHETGELTLSFPTIAALVKAARDKVDFQNLRPVRAPLASGSDDPIALWARASWAADFIGAGALEPWVDGLAQGATLKTFVTETPRLAKRPDLTSYWLIAHALLGNVDAFAKVDKVAAKSRNPFVIALRPRARALLGPSTLAELALRKRSGDEVARALAELRKSAPKSMRQGVPPALPATAPTITVESVTALAKKGALLEFMTQHPAREPLHVWALYNIALWAKVDKGPIEVLERIADFTLTKKRLREATTWLTYEPLVMDDGQREVRLLKLLVARRSERAPEIVLRTLSLLEKSWCRIKLAAETAKLAAALDPPRARAILTRMVANKTWQNYDEEAMPQFRAALKST